MGEQAHGVGFPTFRSKACFPSAAIGLYQIGPLRIVCNFRGSKNNFRSLQEVDGIAVGTIQKRPVRFKLVEDLVVFGFLNHWKGQDRLR